VEVVPEIVLTLAKFWENSGKGRFPLDAPFENLDMLSFSDSPGTDMDLLSMPLGRRVDNQRSDILPDVEHHKLRVGPVGVSVRMAMRLRVIGAMLVVMSVLMLGAMWMLVLMLMGVLMPVVMRMLGAMVV